MTIQIALYLAASLFTFGVSYGLLQSKSKQLLKQIEEHKKQIDMLQQHTINQQTRLAVMEEKANSILRQIDIFQDQTKEGFTELKKLVVSSISQRK